MSDELSASGLISHGVTWLLANASSVGAVVGWFTKPLRERLERLEKEVFGDPRASSVDIAGPAELTRRVGDLEREIDRLREQLTRMVTDDEFRGYISVASQKAERLVETLAFIKGRMKNLRDDD